VGWYEHDRLRWQEQHLRCWY